MELSLLHFEKSDASLARGFRFDNSRKEKDYDNEVDETTL